MSPSLAIVVPAGPGDNAWHVLLPQLGAAREIALVLPVSEPDKAVEYAQRGWCATTARHLRLTCTQAWRFPRTEPSA